ncbi:hypothetical protein AMAG_01704 [Allomyces macrogynus ATCC 38327]|uniref:Chitin-binding type-4 domain-containing protein n=1 Tax=Allomyces macrogynus (strain ATCC 38327) TaxID=578462 RepID=A0A0L0S0C5_ALLM3|nr:hypothetical protein AMAG_01704 [Allomyces macrogynus ATCC 38327]|eukprot:KNE55836.1 hypothetical protein AMAG_01704 [Allomyces macrogynus ATCC 38327]
MSPARQSSPTAYTNPFPMTVAAPGQPLTTVWKPNGHIANPNPIRVLCFPRGIKTMQRGDLDKPASASGILEVGRMRFNANCKDPKDPFTDCSDAFTVPSGWRNGETYACTWVWNFDGNPAGEEYSTCFDIKVAATAKAASGSGATGFESGPASGKPAVAAPAASAAPAAPAVPGTSTYRGTGSYQQDIPGRGFGIQVDSLYTYRIDNRNPSAPLCSPARQSSPTAYTNPFPMTVAAPGQPLTTVWKPNATLPTRTRFASFVSRAGSRPCSAATSTSPRARSGILEVGRMRFNANCKDPKDPFTDCSDAFTVPSGWRNGETYACTWFWNFDGNPAGEEYSTCFDIKVAATAKAASGSGATGFESGPASGKPAVAAPAASAAPAAPAVPAPAPTAAPVVPAVPASPAKPATPSSAPQPAAIPSSAPPAKTTATPPSPQSPLSKFAPRPKAVESVPMPAPKSVVITPPQPLPKITMSLPSVPPSVPAQAKSVPAVQLPVPGKGARAMKEVVAKVMSRFIAAHKGTEARMGVPFRASRASETEVTK